MTSAGKKTMLQRSTFDLLDELDRKHSNGMKIMTHLHGQVRQLKSVQAVLNRNKEKTKKELDLYVQNLSAGLLEFKSDMLVNLEDMMKKKMKQVSETRLGLEQDIDTINSLCEETAQLLAVEKLRYTHMDQHTAVHLLQAFRLIPEKCEDLELCNLTALQFLPAIDVKDIDSSMFGSLVSDESAGNQTAVGPALTMEDKSTSTMRKMVSHSQSSHTATVYKHVETQTDLDPVVQTASSLYQPQPNNTTTNYINYAPKVQPPPGFKQITVQNLIDMPLNGNGLQVPLLPAQFQSVPATLSYHVIPGSQLYPGNLVDQTPILSVPNAESVAKACRSGAISELSCSAEANNPSVLEKENQVASSVKNIPLPIGPAPLTSYLTTSSRGNQGQNFLARQISAINSILKTSSEKSLEETTNVVKKSSLESINSGRDMSDTQVSSDFKSSEKADYGRFVNTFVEVSNTEVPDVRDKIKLDFRQKSLSTDSRRATIDKTTELPEMAASSGETNAPEDKSKDDSKDCDKVDGSGSPQAFSTGGNTDEISEKGDGLATPVLMKSKINEDDKIRQDNSVSEDPSITRFKVHSDDVNEKISPEKQGQSSVADTCSSVIAPALPNSVSDDKVQPAPSPMKPLRRPYLPLRLPAACLKKVKKSPCKNAAKDILREEIDTGTTAVLNTASTEVSSNIDDNDVKSAAEGTSVNQGVTPSITGDKDEKGADVNQEVTPSITGDKDEKGADVNQGVTPGITGDKDEKGADVNQGVTPGITGDKDEKGADVNQGVTLSITGVKDEKGADVNQGVTPSITGVKDEKDADVNQGVTPSITGVKDEKGADVKPSDNSVLNTAASDNVEKEDSHTDMDISLFDLSYMETDNSVCDKQADESGKCFTPGIVINIKQEVESDNCINELNEVVKHIKIASKEDSNYLTSHSIPSSDSNNNRQGVYSEQDWNDGPYTCLAIVKTKNHTTEINGNMQEGSCMAEILDKLNTENVLTKDNDDSQTVEGTEAVSRKDMLYTDQISTIKRNLTNQTSGTDIELEITQQDKGSIGNTTDTVDSQSCGNITDPLDSQATGMTTDPLDNQSRGKITDPLDSQAIGMTTDPLDSHSRGNITDPLDSQTTGMTTDTLELSQATGTDHIGKENKSQQLEEQTAIVATGSRAASPRSVYYDMSPLQKCQIEKSPHLKASLLFEIDDNLHYPIGVTSNSEQHIIVTDTGNNFVKIYSDTGMLIRVLESKIKPSLRRPSAVVVNDFDDIFVKDDYCIRVFNHKYDHIMNIGQSLFSKHYGLVLISTGCLLVLETDLRSPALIYLSQDGSQVWKYPYSPLISGNLLEQSKCRFLAVADNSKLIVSDLGLHQVYITNLQGMFLIRLGNFGKGPFDFNQPADISEDIYGNFVIGDSRNSRVKAYRSDGRLLSIIEFDNQVIRPSGVHLTNSHKLIVVNYTTHKVKVYQLQ